MGIRWLPGQTLASRAGKHRLALRAVATVDGTTRSPTTQQLPGLQLPIVRSPEVVRLGFDALVAETGADELIVVSTSTIMLRGYARSS